MTQTLLSTILLSPSISLPTDVQTNFLMLLRWIHFLAGITWLGLLYFFNLVNVPLMKELDAPTKGKVFPALMSRALWWFRMAAVVTVLAGLAYWGSIVGSDAHNAGASVGTAMASFFIIWTAVWGILYALLVPGKGILDKGAGTGGSGRHRRDCRLMALPGPQQSRMGEQSHAGNRNRRRHRLGNAAQRVGSDLENPEANDPVDQRKCREWETNAREGKEYGKNGIPVVKD